MLSLNHFRCFGIATALALATGYNDKNQAGYSPPISIADTNTYTDSPFKNSIKFKKNIDPVVTSDTASCIIPFSRAGNLIVIKARVDTTEGNFILDTGAPKLILNMTYFRHYRSDTEDTEIRRYNR